LTIAEAMLCVKPVVVTRWSGNLDFTNDQNSFLVDAELVPVGDSAEPYRATATWAEPNLRSAAHALQTVYRSPDVAKQRALRGRFDVRCQFSASRIAKMVGQRLATIAHDLRTNR
jgi:glycosyltransferase involved in cell wall biosynthesis